MLMFSILASYENKESNSFYRFINFFEYIHLMHYIFIPENTITAYESCYTFSKINCDATMYFIRRFPKGPNALAYEWFR